MAYSVEMYANSRLRGIPGRIGYARPRPTGAAPKPLAGSLGARQTTYKDKLRGVSRRRAAPQTVGRSNFRGHGYGGNAGRTFAVSPVGVGGAGVANALQRNRDMLGRTGGGSGGSSGGNNPLADVLSQYQQAMDDANAANDLRYQQGMNMLGDRYTRGMGYLDNAGQQEGADIRQDYHNLGTRIDQDLISRGLSGTTIRPTQQMGVQRELSSSLGRMNERLAQQKVATDAQLSGDIAGFLERREDQAPDISQMLALMQAAGQGGGYGGNGYRGGASSMAGVPLYVSPAQMGYQVPAAAWGGVAPWGSGGGQAQGGGGYPNIQQAMGRGSGGGDSNNARLLGIQQRRAKEEQARANRAAQQRAQQQARNDEAQRRAILYSSHTTV